MRVLDARRRMWLRRNGINEHRGIGKATLERVRDALRSGSSQFVYLGKPKAEEIKQRDVHGIA